LPVERVRAFEDGLLGSLRQQHPEILSTIRDSSDLDDSTTAKLKSAVESYAKAFA
jgi:F-type H+/Na+-transporting ATPase subunit alpha